MCGIAGSVSLSNKYVPDRSVMSRVNDAIAHRGPDDIGIEIFPKAALTQRRLAIIDLSPGGHQPKPYARGQYWITFNGEIYNFQEIKDRLRKKGYKFQSQSDTEVILAAYDAYKEKCLQHLRGMFAFALYDKKEHVLFAARDRLGKKPFKYYLDDDKFVFASEVKAILAHPGVSREIDPDALRQYLYWGFVPSPKTGFQHIAKLPPAHYLTLQDGKLSVKRYWDVKFEPDYDRSEEETASQLRELVEESVRLRLISDVPVGAFLSAGIDSTIVVGTMAKFLDKPVRTFTIGVKGWENDESQAAAETARIFGTNHKAFHVTPNVKEVLPKIVKAYDEPFADSSAIPSYYVSQLARKHVTVALNGDGGDENFFGYSNYETFLFTQRHQSTRPLFAAAYSTLKPFEKMFYRHPLYQRMLRVSHIMKYDPFSSYPLFARGYCNYADINDFDAGKKLNIRSEFQRFLPRDRSSTANDILFHDFHSTLPDGLMTKIDIATMQHGLEGRAPLLDHKLVEFAATIPLELKYKGGQTKYILRKAFADLLPRHVVNLPKRGFVPPTGQWLRTTLRSTMRKRLSNPEHQVFSFLDFATTQQLLEWHDQSIADYSPHLWKFFMLALWFEEYQP